jgi:hypothetical protein
MARQTPAPLASPLTRYSCAPACSAAYDDRHRALVANALDRRAASAIRQIEIEQHGVDVVNGQVTEPLGHAARTLELKLRRGDRLLLEQRLEEVGIRSVVFDHQDVDR